MIVRQVGNYKNKPKKTKQTKKPPEKWTGWESQIVTYTTFCIPEQNPSL